MNIVLIRLWFLVVLAFNLVAANDDLQFSINWSGKFPGNEDDSIKDHFEILDMTTSNMERYKCKIPINFDQDKLQGEHDSVVQIKTANLLSDIYSKKFCSYRIESYWIYELCHGEHVKQYHETKNAGKRAVTESYFLGKFNSDVQEPDYLKDDKNVEKPNIHWKNFDGKKVATYMVKYTDGTPCEILPGVNREISILYACDPNGNDNIVTFEETSSCIYEMVVVTKSICVHPAYKPKQESQKSVDCYALDNSPIKPVEQVPDEYNDLEQQDENTARMTDSEGSTFIVHYQNKEGDPETVVIENEEGTHAKVYQTMPRTSTEPSVVKSNPIPPMNAHDKKMIDLFFKGELCLNGGSGWWKFEICYGKHVIQYHEDEHTKQRTNVMLGTWDMNKHLHWVIKHHKRPIANLNERRTFSLLYSDGLFCEGVNKNRFVEVKFKCLPTTSEGSHALGMYLIEPNTCEYLLGIESPWFCNIVKNVDMNGIPISVNTND